MSAPTDRGRNDVERDIDEAVVDSSTETRSPATVTVPAPRRAPEVTVPAPRAAPARSAAPAKPVAPGAPAAPVGPVAPAAPVAPAVPRLGWLELGVAAATYVGLLVVLHALLDAAGLLGPWLAAASATAALGAVVAALAVRVRSLAPLFLHPAQPVLLLAGAALGLATYLLARGLAASWNDLGGTLPPAQPGLWTFSGVGSTVAVVLLAGLVVPCVEELLFRGVVVSALGRYGIGFAATGSAVLFGAAHGLTFVVVAAVALGAVNAVLVWRRHSIWPGVVAHATFNLVSIGVTLALV